MRKLGTRDIGALVAQLTLGASESVDMMGFLDDPLFNWSSGVTSGDVMALVDERLSARAVLRRVEKVARTISDLVDPNRHMEEHRFGHWHVRIPPFLPPAHLLLVDAQAVIYSDMGWSTSKSDSVYLVDEPSEIETLRRLFEAAWSGTTDLIYRDPFGGLTAVEQQKIITVSAAQWEELISELAQHPEHLYTLPSRRFEELVAELLSRDGMDVRLTSFRKDGGRDIFAYLKTSVGEHLFYVECKRYSPDIPVGVRIVRELFGVVEAERATAGLLVTTSRFTGGALRFRESIRHRMSLKDFEVLVQWLDQHS